MRVDRCEFVATIESPPNHASHFECGRLFQRENPVFFNPSLPCPHRKGTVGSFNFPPCHQCLEHQIRPVRMFSSLPSLLVRTFTFLLCFKTMHSTRGGSQSTRSRGTPQLHPHSCQRHATHPTSHICDVKSPVSQAQHIWRQPCCKGQKLSFAPSSRRQATRPPGNTAYHNMNHCVKTWPPPSTKPPCTLHTLCLPQHSPTLRRTHQRKRRTTQRDMTPRSYTILLPQLYRLLRGILLRMGGMLAPTDSRGSTCNDMCSCSSHGFGILGTER